MFTKTTRESSSSSARSHTREVFTSTPITPETTTSAPSTTRSEATVSAWKPESPGVSIRLILRSCHSQLQSDAESDICAALLVLFPVGDGVARVDRARAGSSFPPGRASPRRARSCPSRGGRRRRRCGSSRLRWASSPPEDGWTCAGAESYAGAAPRREPGQPLTRAPARFKRTTRARQTAANDAATTPANHGSPRSVPASTPCSDASAQTASVR